jgi:hypothetical protein
MSNKKALQQKRDLEAERDHWRDLAKRLIAERDQREIEGQATELKAQRVIAAAGGAEGAADQQIRGLLHYVRQLEKNLALFLPSAATNEHDLQVLEATLPPEAQQATRGVTVLPAGDDQQCGVSFTVVIFDNAGHQEIIKNQWRYPAPVAVASQEIGARLPGLAARSPLPDNLVSRGLIGVSEDTLIKALQRVAFYWERPSKRAEFFRELGAVFESMIWPEVQTDPHAPDKHEARNRFRKLAISSLKKQAKMGR